MRNAELGMNSIGVYSAFRIPHSPFRKSGGWQEKSGQWPAKRAEVSGRVRKAPNEPNWNRPLIACSEGVNVDGFGPVYAERTQFRGLSTARHAALRENRHDRKESVSSFYFHLTRFPRAKRSAAPSKRVGSRISPLSVGSRKALKGPNKPAQGNTLSVLRWLRSFSDARAELRPCSTARSRWSSRHPQSENETALFLGFARLVGRDRTT